ncbi:uncharacterized protein TRIADDRAFT_57823 [Trichoplax adhaerens]|uniref:protein-tyrosine-phosphatase n=1 Tax=Trichoplax adhaerens TaxID=10228 RepID=B3S1N2_TRIAD|nr:hypothetical protein TRIADDRAFT_57823 [Trichoplax adhaerens]EDV23004.1 hypothetical protein TRIADDRAFT_57823 [Trichoplax adhaerens]|eukprot:XP_002113914.1 hypothetical protein TRIADDRAFT_57823 [Trichoplax adhaerens]
MGFDEDDFYSIRCWTNNDNTKFTWSRVSSRVSPFHVSTDQYQIQNKSGESTLILPWNSLNDFYRYAGVYECQATSTASNSPQRKTLWVGVTHSASPVQPSIISQVGYVRDTLVLTTLSNNVVTCNYIWYHNGSRYTRCDNACNCSFDSLRLQDAGVYEVIYPASDKSNITGAFMTLTVLEKKCSQNQNCLNGAICMTDNSCGCLPGFNGTSCQTACSLPFRCGPACQFACQPESVYCSSDMYGCMCPSGVTGISCKTDSCPADNYGPNCQLKCNGCNNHGSCQSKTGCLCQSGYSGIYCEEVAGGSVVVIIGVVVAIIAAVSLGVIAYIWYSRRRARALANIKSPDPVVIVDASGDNPSSLDTNLIRSRLGQYKYVVSKAQKASLVQNIKIPTKPIIVKDLLDRINALKEDSALALKEFESIPPCKETHAIADMKGNAKKNRSQSVISYDHSIVTVGDGGVNSYINASHVHGYMKPNGYIVTQGPLKSTCNDFWTMVWEKETCAIVMLTELSEKDEAKFALRVPVKFFQQLCYKYWPEEKDTYGNVCVTLENVGEVEKQEVKQFHFTAWPHGGIPESSTGLFRFRSLVHAFNPSDAGPIVIHSSEGSSRCAMFVALDINLDRARKQGDIDVLENVGLMSHHRKNILVRVNEYLFVYEAILDALIRGNTQMSLKNLQTFVSRADTSESGSKNNPYTIMFQCLRCQEGEHDDFAGASLSANENKNRFPDILARDKYRVKLSSSDSSDYINAVFIDSYLRAREFIVTQYPLPNTINDFWKLIMEQNVACVVTLGSFSNHPPYWWPSNKKHDVYDNIKVEILEVATVDDLTIRQLKATEKNHSKTNIMSQFQLSGWEDEDKAPAQASTIINLVNRVQECIKTVREPGPIVVQCLNGRGQSGTFCTIYSALNTAIEEKAVDIYSDVLSMRVARRGLVQSEEQLRFCFEVVVKYTQDTGLL